MCRQIGEEIEFAAADAGRERAWEDLVAISITLEAWLSFSCTGRAWAFRSPEFFRLAEARPEAQIISRKPRFVVLQEENVVQGHVAHGNQRERRCEHLKGGVVDCTAVAARVTSRDHQPEGLIIHIRSISIWREPLFLSPCGRAFTLQT